MNFKEWLLNEMRINRSGDNPASVIAFRDNIWLYDSQGNNKELAKQIWKKFNDAFPDKRDLPIEVANKLDEEDPDMEEVERFASDYLQDAMIGYLHNRSLRIHMSDNPSPVSSSLMKKVAQSLGADNVEYDTEERYQTDYSSEEYDTPTYSYSSRWDMVGDVPDELYHGTTTTYFAEITRYGLSPGRSDSNFAKNQVFHDDKIFLADRESESRYYAANAVTEAGGLPMVVQIRIPDKSLLMPDYDVDRYASASRSGKNTYSYLGFGDREYEISSVGPWKSTKHAGKYAYQGRIPASYIIRIMIRFSQNDWENVDIKYVQELISRYQDEWVNYYGYDLDELDELDNGWDDE